MTNLKISVYNKNNNKNAVKRRVGRARFFQRAPTVETGKTNLHEHGLGAAHRSRFPVRLRRVCPLAHYAVEAILQQIRLVSRGTGEQRW